MTGLYNCLRFLLQGTKCVRRIRCSSVVYLLLFGVAGQALAHWPPTYGPPVNPTCVGKNNLRPLLANSFRWIDSHPSATTQTIGLNQSLQLQAAAIDTDQFEDPYPCDWPYTSISYSWSATLSGSSAVDLGTGDTISFSRSVAGVYTVLCNAADPTSPAVSDDSTHPAPKSWTVNVVEADIDTDSDNSGSITDADDPVEEADPGRLVALKGFGDVTLKSVPSSLPSGCTANLVASSGGSCTKVWKSMAKGAGDEIVVTGSGSQVMLPLTVYVEGIATGSAMLDLVIYNGATELYRDKIKVTAVSVTYSSDTKPPHNYGFDNYVNPQEGHGPDPWKSVAVGQSDTVIANISPASVASRIFFYSSGPTVSPQQASTASEQLTLTGTSEADTIVEARLGRVSGDIAGVLHVHTAVRDEKDVALIVVNEENDDVQLVPVGARKQNAPCVDVGPDGICNTYAAASDQQVIQVSCGQPYQIAIEPSFGSGMLWTFPPWGDDTIFNNCITTGPNGICETVAVSPDNQVIPYGNGQPWATCIDTGSDGVCDTTALQNDSQLTEVGSTPNYQICVTCGANGFTDSVPAGDDWPTADGLAINTGQDGICQTTANNTNVMVNVTFTKAALEERLNNVVYNQAPFKFNVTEIMQKTVNYDMNRDGCVNVGTSLLVGPLWNEETNAIRNQCGDAINYDYNVFFVNRPNLPYNGITTSGQPYIFVFPDNATDLAHTTAHELGHAAFRIPDQTTAHGQYDNLMIWDSTYAGHLFFDQWQTITRRF